MRFSIVYGGVVDDQLRSILCQFEPETIDYYPIRLICQDGPDVAPGRSFFIMNPTRNFDAILFNQSDLRYPSEDSPATRPKRGYPEYVFSRSAIGDAHLWSGRFFARTAKFCSAELHDALQQAGMKYFDWKSKHRVVDEEWVMEDNYSPEAMRRQNLRGGLQPPDPIGFDEHYKMLEARESTSGDQASDS